MRRIRSKNTAPELLLRRALWSCGIRYRLHRAGLPGTPDIVIRKVNTVIFVDGDFWHGRVAFEKGSNALRRSFRGPNADYWINRIRRNMRRDDIQTSQLLKEGWHVIRIWETTLFRHPQSTIDTVVRILAGALKRLPKLTRL